MDIEQINNIAENDTENKMQKLNDELKAAYSQKTQQSQDNHFEGDISENLRVLSKYRRSTSWASWKARRAARAKAARRRAANRKAAREAKKKAREAKRKERQEAKKKAKE